MRWISMTAIALLLGTAAAADKPKVVTFGKDDLGKVPGGWKANQTGKGEGSQWKVTEDITAPSKTGFVLSQTAESPGLMYNLCEAGGATSKDVEVSVAFKSNGGKNDQGGGIVWRFQDANNYYVARFNTLEDNYRLYRVVAGKRTQIGSKEDVKIRAGEWHTLGVRMVGDRIECRLDGKAAFEAKDATFTKAGGLGLWTKADARTSFDNFQVENLGRE